VLTGAQYGCIPVVPTRLAYPEWIDDCYESHETDIHAEANSAVEHLMSGKKTPVSSLARLSKDYLAPIYKRSFDHLVADFLGENKNY
jgi:hypothetical protein